LGNLKESDLLDEVGVGRRIILNVKFSLVKVKKKEVKTSLLQALQAPRVARGRDSHIA
jgi:hypothetical protein